MVETTDRSDRVEPDESLVQLLDPRPLATRHKIGLVAMAIIALSPLFFDQITIRRMTGALFIAMFAMSWDVVSGYTGEISFGHAFFFALGGYTSAVLASGLHITLWGYTPSWLASGMHPFLTILLGVFIAALGGLLIGVPALRVSGPYLSLITLIAPLLLFQLFILYSDTFGGESGLSAPAPIIGTSPEAVFTIGPETSVDALYWGPTEVARVLNFYLALVVFLIILVVLLAVTRSNAGAVFYAIRSGEEVVSATGKNPAKFKIFVFVLSAAVGGFAGAVFVHTNVGDPAPSQLLFLEVSLIVIIASVIGSMGTITGAAIGGIFVHMLELSVLGQMEESFLGIDLSLMNDIVGYQIADMSFLVLGITALVVIYAVPGGLLRWGLRTGVRTRNRVSDYRQHFGGDG